MRYIARRFLPRYRRRVGPKKRRRRLLAAFLALSCVCALCSEWGLLSVSEELTQEAARGYVLSEISQAVNQELKDGESSFIQVEKSQPGQVSVVSADAARLNALKSGLLKRLRKKLNGKAAAFVPIGSLMNVGLLNGRGFQVPVKLKLEGSADVSFHTEFVSAGINQSCHRVTMTVRARVYSQSKRFETLVEEESSTVLSEIVVVGKVPEIALLEE